MAYSGLMRWVSTAGLGRREGTFGQLLLCGVLLFRSGLSHRAAAEVSHSLMGFEVRDALVATKHPMTRLET